VMMLPGVSHHRRPVFWEIDLHRQSLASPGVARLQIAVVTLKQHNITGKNGSK
jgi:hypothetical protein